MKLTTVVNYFALGVDIKELILEIQNISIATLSEVGKITRCSPVYCVSDTYLLKLCWYWFCIGHFFLWHLLLVLLHYFLHSPIQSWDCHFNIVGLIFPFSTRETNSQSNAGLQRNPVTLFTAYLAKETKRFSTLPSLHGKYAQYSTSEKSICATKTYERNERKVTQYLDGSGKCFPIATTYPSALAPWLFSIVQVFPSQE